MDDRHKSHAIAITKLDALKAAILSLPPDSEISVSSSLLFVERPVFLEFFSGFTRVRKNREGCLFVDWQGVSWASIDPNPQQQSEFVDL